MQNKVDMDDLKRAMLKGFLRQFYITPPNKDKGFQDQARKIFENFGYKALPIMTSDVMNDVPRDFYPKKIPGKGVGTQNLLFDNDRTLCQLCQWVLLEYRRYIHWEYINSYRLIEDFIGDGTQSSGGSVIQNYSEPDLLIIRLENNTPPNKQRIPMVKAVCEERDRLLKDTLVLGTANNTDIKLVPFSWKVTSKSVV